MTCDQTKPPPRRNPYFKHPEGYPPKPADEAEHIEGCYFTGTPTAPEKIVGQYSERVGLSQKNEMIWQVLLRLISVDQTVTKGEVVCEAKRWVNAFLEETDNVEIK